MNKRNPAMYKIIIPDVQVKFIPWIQESYINMLM